MKTSFETRVSRMGLSSFVDINIFVILFSFLTIPHFSESLKSKSTQMLRPQKRNSEVSFNDTLLNFGLGTMSTSIREIIYLENLRKKLYTFTRPLIAILKGF